MTYFTLNNDSRLKFFTSTLSPLRFKAYPLIPGSEEMRQKLRQIVSLYIEDEIISIYEAFQFLSLARGENWIDIAYELGSSKTIRQLEIFCADIKPHDLEKKLRNLKANRSVSPAQENDELYMYVMQPYGDKSSLCWDSKAFFRSAEVRALKLYDIAEYKPVPNTKRRQQIMWNEIVKHEYQEAFIENKNSSRGRKGIRAKIFDILESNAEYKSLAKTIRNALISDWKVLKKQKIDNH
ncbi:TPA: hypothetical protein MW256_003643 [Acinetobacter baumannii]|nr:hypothetical protein [Acinetobacter baumannii]